MHVTTMFLYSSICSFQIFSIHMFSKKNNNSLSDTMMSFAQQQPQPQNAHLNKFPRKSWSSIAYNNKNFPDGKLGYGQQTIGTNASNNNNKLLNKGYSKFERSGQDVMARASQIVQKNKSFRPRERPKKGLKNLQTVKTLTAGQNLSNASSVKTRKQPLTVTAQFQNSLSALMDTLNQANPFFIRCIKSNSDKIPNKFDNDTVIRQLRYTGMLETVRIRRAGYNVRLTYEEFIQLYRILLPKGLVSSQKDVRDFMNTMDLNKQHYQLGISKIYMRESQKTRLDIRLHTKIIDSIIMIQRWFRSISQRRKYVLYRSSAIVIQSFWRMHLGQKELIYRKSQVHAAIIIQSTWRMYLTRKWYNTFQKGIIVVQAHIRGKLARIMFKKLYKQKLMKERYKLRPTQSLPVTERNVDVTDERDVLKRTLNKPHYSLDSEMEKNPMKIPKLYSDFYTTSNLYNENNTDYNLLDQQKRDVLHKAENQFRCLMISSGGNNQDYSNLKLNKVDLNPKRQMDEMVDSRSGRVYDLERAAKNYFNESKSDEIKPLVRRVDSGPAVTHRKDSDNFDIVFDSMPPPDSLIHRHITRVSTNVLNQGLGKQSSRRDVVCRSTGDDLNATYHFQNYPNNLNQNPTIMDDKSISNQNNAYKQQQQQQQDLTFSTPKGKAAAFLGTINEDKHTKVDNLIAKARRSVKSNFSDEYSGMSGSVPTHHQQLTRQSPVVADPLRRRNSDPSTNKITMLEVNRGNDMYQSSTHINIAGHRFRKAARIGKAEKCASCQESDAFVNEGHRCLDCKVLVHTKCIQNGGVRTLQCEAKRSKRLQKHAEKHSTHNSKYSGTREYKDSTDKIISDAKELQLMQDFITQKICKMDNNCDKVSEVDRVFKQALREFKDNLVAQYSVAHKQNSDTLNIKYRDLIANFEHVMETCCERKDDFPLTMGVNAFRGFLNEFMVSRETEKPKAKRKKEKKRKVDEHTNYNGHTFQLTIINIPTACEICQLFLLWPIERGLVCQSCRLTCHKKCYQKAYTCNKISSPANNNTFNTTTFNSTLFGIPLTNLCIADGGVKIPVRIEQLLTKIEMHGLYAEGIYRKSGVNSKIKELKTKMSELNSSVEIDYESYNVHVLTNVLKSFLREMPEPLLSFDRYDDFLRASELSETVDRVSTLMSLIKKLPPAHHALLERLIFHLALVAQREQFNRMSASSLAIVFAPCVLRTNRQIPAQDSLNDIGRQTKCIETLITQKMMNVKSTLADIDTLDTAAHTATTRLSTLRSSKVFTPEELIPRSTNLESETEEMLLEDHIQEIKKEKAMLTSTLPSLARASSDDDLLSTDMDGEGGSLDDLSRDSHYTSERDMKESIDSSIGSIGDNVSRKTIESDSPSMLLTKDCCQADIDVTEPSAVSYNLRDQNIYVSCNPKLSNEMIDSNVATLSVSHPSGSMISGSQSRWTGSHHNLSTYPILTGNTFTELHRQKPLAVRSMSSGYESIADVTKIIHSSVPSSPGNSGGIGGGSSAQATDISMQLENSGKNGKNTKKQNNLDDEPIMV